MLYFLFIELFFLQIHELNIKLPSCLCCIVHFISWSVVGIFFLISGVFFTVRAGCYEISKKEER